ncbi:hypothetical protein Tco_0787272, partial [Tanacetum coccineum]
GHSKPKELSVFESYIVEAEEGSEKKIKWWAWLLLGIGSFAPLASCYIIDKKLHIQTSYMGHPTVTQRDAHHLHTTLFMRFRNKLLLCALTSLLKRYEQHARKFQKPSTLFNKLKPYVMSNIQGEVQHVVVSVFTKINVKSRAPQWSAARAENLVLPI